MGVVKDLLKRITPWYDEDEVNQREAATAGAVNDSHRIRRDAEAELLKSYRQAGNAIGRHNWAPEKKAK